MSNGLKNLVSVIALLSVTVVLANGIISYSANAYGVRLSWQPDSQAAQEAKTELTANAKLLIDSITADTAIWRVRPGELDFGSSEGWSTNVLGQQFKVLPPYEPGSAELIVEPWTNQVTAIARPQPLVPYKKGKFSLPGR